MLNLSCPVQEAFNRISQAISLGRVAHAPCAQRVQELASLLSDISSGRSGPESIHAIQARLELLQTGCKHKTCNELGAGLSSRLKDSIAIYRSHVDAHYCPTGECTLLSAAPCQMACPASVDAPSYIALVGMGRYTEAMQVLLEDLPFPGTLGRVCVHPCEKACRRGKVDEPIAICQLKRVAFDKAYREIRKIVKPAPNRYKEKIAIIGSGPAGLSTGYFLAKLGYRPTVFESMPEPGGMLRWAIPTYRLPREILEIEIDHIQKMGVEIRTGVTFGKEFTLDSLRSQGYVSIFLGIGAWSCIALPIEGAENHPGIVDSLTFLRYSSLREALVGKRIVVVGGGNVAVDCARTALRSGVDEVNIVYRRSRNEMPARREEVKAAEDEGAILTYLSSPLRVHGNNGTLSGLECIRNRLSDSDATGRRRPIPVEGTEFLIPADTIISAIGQRTDFSSLEPIGKLELSKDRLLKVHPGTMETSIPGVFSGGDMVTGPATVVEAVASGKKAAQAIHHHLRRLPASEFGLLPLRRHRFPVMEILPQEKAASSRPTLLSASPQERIGDFREVEHALSELGAAQEAKRCLRCDLCISCGRCVEICREQMAVDAIHLSYVEHHGSEQTDFLRTPEHCVGCGSCAVNCPTHAIVMEDTGNERRIRMCGTEMSRHALVPCASCGDYFAPQKHLDYIRRRTDSVVQPLLPEDLCPGCARRIKAEESVGQMLK